MRTGTIVGLRLRELVLFAAAETIFVVVVVADVLELCGGAGTAPKASCLEMGCSCALHCGRAGCIV